MPKLVDRTGERYGKLVCVKFHKDLKKDKSQWECKCDCGNQYFVRAQHLANGTTTACLDCSRYYKLQGASASPLYAQWNSMKQRVASNPSYEHVFICKEWYDFWLFEEWARNNGWQKGYHLHRIDSWGNYEPKNCEWLTKTEHDKKEKRKYMPPAELLTAKQKETFLQQMVALHGKAVLIKAIQVLEERNDE